jgi:acyl-homoserine lactone synthase
VQQESQQAGFKVRPMGPPTLVEGQAFMAAAIEISPDGRKSLRGHAGLHGSCLFGLDLAISVPDGMSHDAA